MKSEELVDNTPRIEPEAAAEVLRYRLEIDDTKEGVRTFLYRLRIKVYDPSRATSVTRLARFWEGPLNPYYQIFARLTLPDGSVRLFDQHDMRERNYATAGQANSFLGRLVAGNDWKLGQGFLAITGVEKGAILDVWERVPEVQREDWLMSSIQMPDLPIRDFEYTDRYTPSVRFLHHFFVLNPSGGQMIHDEEAGVLRFTAHHLRSIPREPLGPPATYTSLTIIQTEEPLSQAPYRLHSSVPLPDPVPLSRGPWAFFATGQDFEDADKGYVTRRLKAKAEELVAGAANDRDQVRRIYDYVQTLYQRNQHATGQEAADAAPFDSLDDLVTHESSALNARGQQPFHYLLIALLRGAGFECHTAFHPMRTAFPFNVELASPFFVSHWTVAVKVDLQWMLCDPCYDPPLQAGSLPWQIEGEPALLALPQQQAFLNVPPLPAEDSVADTTADLRLDDRGNLLGECTRTYTGHYAQWLRDQLHAAGREDWDRLSRSLLELEHSPCNLRLLGVDGLEDQGAPVRLRAAVAWPAYAARLRDRMILPLAVWPEGQPPLLTEEVRTTPVFFPFAKVEHETITIHLPPDCRPGFLPQAIRSQHGEFAYLLAVTHDPKRGILTVERSLTNRALLIPVAQYAEARDWFRLVSVADQIGITLLRDPPSAKPRAGKPPPP